MIGGLLYLTTIGPDIMHVVFLVARFQKNPRESHVAIVKSIFKYLKGTLEHGLWDPKDTNYSLSSYTNVDWVGCVDDRKITSGGSLFLRCSLVSWLEKKQDSVSLSTIEVEYIIASSCYT